MYPYRKLLLSFVTKISNPEIKYFINTLYICKIKKKGIKTMSNTAALLGNLLAVNADINFYTQMQLFWQHKYEANQEKLQKQIQYEEKWENAFDDGMDSEKKIDFKGFHKEKGEEWSEEWADKYAHAKVSQYDEALSMELFELDIEYDTMRTMYDTMLQELRAAKDADKQAVSTAAQDTGLLQS